MKDSLFRFAITAELAWICGGGMAAMQIPSAYAWRGYWAIGGEWLLILLAAVVGGWLGDSLAGLVIKAETKTNRKAHR